MNKIFYQIFIKRAFDFFLSLLVFLLLWWLFFIIAAVIFFTDGFPIFFTQRRAGQYGKPFKIYKFRTMVKNAALIGPHSTPKNDPRITPIGSFLRKTSLDELPQIFNVIKGDMSIVGYRPGVYEDYTNEELKSAKFNVKPGITGYSQIHGRSNITLEEKIKWDLQYVKDISFITDLKIIFLTIPVVLRREGSY